MKKSILLYHHLEIINPLFYKHCFFQVENIWIIRSDSNRTLVCFNFFTLQFYKYIKPISKFHASHSILNFNIHNSWLSSKELECFIYFMCVICLYKATPPIHFSFIQKILIKYVVYSRHYSKIYESGSCLKGIWNSSGECSMWVRRGGGGKHANSNTTMLISEGSNTGESYQVMGAENKWGTLF